MLLESSGPSSSSTLNPNSSQVNSGWEFGSSDWLASHSPGLSLARTGCMEAARAEKGPPGGGEPEDNAPLVSL